MSSRWRSVTWCSSSRTTRRCRTNSRSAGWTSGTPFWNTSGKKPVISCSSAIGSVSRDSRRAYVPAVTRRFLTDHEHDVVRQLADRLLPPHGEFPGAGAAGTADYVDRLLGAFASDPPAIWAAGPYSGRFGGDGGFGEYLPLSRLEALAWRTRLE